MGKARKEGFTEAKQGEAVNYSKGSVIPQNLAN